MIRYQVVILLDDVGDFGVGEAVSEDFCLSLHLLHQVTILVHHFANLALQIRPDFLLILDDILRLVELILQILHLVLQLTHLVVLILLKIGQELLEDENLGLPFVSLLRQLLHLRAQGCLTLLVRFKGRISPISTFCQGKKLLIEPQVGRQVFDLLFQLFVLLSVVVQLGGLFERQELLIVPMVSEKAFLVLFSG